VYPNCLRAHLRFRCRYRKQQPKTSDVITCRQPSPRATSGHPPTPTSGDKMVAPSEVMTSQRVLKRKSDSEDNDDETVATKRRSPPNDVLRRAVVEGSRGVVDVGRELNGLMGVVSAAQAPGRSAFQRVDKVPLQGPITPPSPSQATSSSSPSDVAGITPTMLPLSVVTTSPLTALDITSASARLTGTAGSPGLFVFPPAQMQSERLRAPVMLNAGFPAPNNRDVFYPSIGNDSAAAAAYARNFVVNNNNNVSGNDVKVFNRSSSLGVQSRHVPVPPSLPLSVPGGFRTSNPMMERLLQLVTPARCAAQSSSKSTNGPAVSSHATTTLSASFPSLQLAQNWCAKCNTSFRMTSDLVYHMRTHHKRDLDPASQGRRKDDNKLRCDVCGETFKERHHLTRHMTSHT